MTETAAEPRGNESLEAVAAWLGGHEMAKAFGLRLEALEDGYARLTMDRNDVTVGGIRNSINGGVQAACAELAAHVALRTVLDEGGRVQRTQDLSVSYLSSAVGERTVAEARVLRRGRLSVVEVTLTDSESGAINCRARVSCILQRGQSR
jgi:uncharacterized protein (TIGR00369 family)